MGLKIEYIDEPVPVYDITVEDNHNFFGNGILVHNCSEIALHNSDDESFVCVLSSMNVLHYDEWKSTDAVQTMIYFLDAVVSDFLKKLEDLRDSSTTSGKRAFIYMEKAYNFAKRQRALGLGVLGWHSLLQSKGLPFDSVETSKLNVEIFRFIKDKSYKASAELADFFGEPEYLIGYGRRNVTLNAVAPTTSSAFILGQVSQSVEPIWSNCYVKDVAKMKVTIQNPILKKFLCSINKDNKTIWDSIKKHDGSVQHLDFLSTSQKDVFRTFAEINQSSIINQAAVRQDYIDQSQSLNLMIPPDLSTKDVNKLLIDSWKLGVKTLYYQHSMNSAQVLSRKKLQINDQECLACQG